MTPFRRKQLLGIAGALPAFVVVALTLDHATNLFAFLPLPPDDLPNRLSFALRWMLLPGVCLLLGVIVAARRGFVPDAIDGTRTSASRSLEINLRYNQNTLEQVVLACIAWASLAIALPIAQLMLIPAMASLFAAGRIAFWIGYLIHPMGRAFGMVITVLPTVASYVWLICISVVARVSQVRDESLWPRARKDLPGKAHPLAFESTAPVGIHCAVS